MVIPFNDYAFDNAVGTKGVVKTDFGYHVVEVIGHKNVSPAYKIAYLAKPILPSNETISIASNAAAQFVAESKNAKTFNDQAKLKNLPILSASDIKANDFSINAVGSSRSLVRWIYEKSEGAVSEPTEIGDQIVVALISAINKPGLLSVSEARPTVEGIVRNEKKAKIIIDTKIKGSTLNEVAASTGFSVGRLDSLFFGNNFITDLGSEPKIIGAAFNKSLSSKASSAIAGSNGVFAVQSIAVAAVPSSFNNAALSESLLQSRKMSIYRSAESLRKSATIKDLRSTFY
jgi:peptidyl-prolyl cis-trans isomerase D